MRKTFAALIAGGLLLSACSSGGDDADGATDTTIAPIAVDATTSSTLASIPVTSSTVAESFSGDSLITSDSDITTSGLGVIRVEMNVNQAEKAGNDRLITQPGATDQCFIVVLERSPGDIEMLVHNGLVVSVIVNDNSVTTRSGAQVGNTETEITDLFGERIVATDTLTGQNLAFVPQDPGFENVRVIFITDGEVVTQIRAGRLPEVEWENGCLDAS